MIRNDMKKNMEVKRKLGLWFPGVHAKMFLRCVHCRFWGFVNGRENGKCCACQGLGPRIWGFRF